MCTEREYGYYVTACDACGAELEERYATWEESVRGKKLAGWFTVRDGALQEWVDLCPECARLELGATADFKDIGGDSNG